MSSPRPLVTVVLPAHNEAESLLTVVPAVMRTLEDANVAIQIIIVDDGSEDDTAEVAAAMVGSDPRIECIMFSRNFGHQSALLAGLRASRGDAVVMMDSDGQHPPELVREMIDRWEGGADVVNTIRTDNSRTGILKRVSSRLFYKVFSWVSRVQVIPGSADFRLLSRDAADALDQVVGSPPFVRGAVARLGFNQESLQYISHPRTAGNSSFVLRRMIRLSRDALYGHPARLVALVARVGLVGSSLALAVTVYATVVRLFTQSAVPGWASVMALLSLQMFLMFAMLSLISTIIANIADNVPSRQHYIIRHHLRQTDDGAAPGVS